MALAEGSVNAALGRVLRGLRAELDYSQSRMGLLLGVGQRTVSDIESGKRGLSAFEILDFPKRLATVLPYKEEEIRERLLQSPHLGLVGEDQPEPLDSTPPEEPIPGYLNPEVERVAA